MKKILLLLILLLNLHITIKEGLISLELGHASAQIQYEETLDDLVVLSDAYGECQFCHLPILKTELAFHQQQQCFYREATCETCHQKYRPDQGDCSCKDNIYNNNNGNDYTICYRCGRYKDQCTCNSNNPYDINNPPGGGGGSSSSSDTQNPSPESQEDNPEDSIVGWLPCDLNKLDSTTTQQMKMIPGVHSVPNLPSTFLPQEHEMECVANTIAMVAGIVDGTDPAITKRAIRQIAFAKSFNIDRDGLPVGEIKSLLYDYCAITDENKFSRKAVENHIDTYHKPVMAIIETVGKTILPDAHMVMIVGYDSFHYYCAYGKENPAVVPKEDLEVKDSKGNMKYKIYFYNGKKHINQ
jgi:hypothetical protein